MINVLTGGLRSYDLWTQIVLCGHMFLLLLGWEQLLIDCLSVVRVGLSDSQRSSRTLLVIVCLRLLVILHSTSTRLCKYASLYPLIFLSECQCLFERVRKPNLLLMTMCYLPEASGSCTIF